MAVNHGAETGRARQGSTVHHNGVAAVSDQHLVHSYKLPKVHRLAIKSVLSQSITTKLASGKHYNLTHQKQKELAQVLLKAHEKRTKTRCA